jgi:ribonuclease BN (tRNA processing enzyme)
VEFCTGADFLIHDGEYTDSEYRRLVEWGHSSYTDVLKLAFAAGVKRLGLFHLNQERTDDQTDKIIDHCRRLIADAGHSMECFAVARDMTFAL